MFLSIPNLPFLPPVTPASITVGIDPAIATLGPLHLGWYGLLTILAAVAGIILAHREARRRGFDSESVWTVTIWAIGGGLIGARALHVIDRWSTYADHPLRIFNYQGGGLAIEGALLGGLIAGVLAARAQRLPVLSLADAVAPGIILAQAIGRVACFFTGDALGAPTGLPWGIVYTNPESMAPELGVAYQPVFAYEGLWDLAVLAALLLLRHRLHRQGALFASYLALYASGKFMVTFLREERIWLWGLQQAHLLALLLLFVAALIWLWQPLTNRPKRPGPLASRPAA